MFLRNCEWPLPVTNPCSTRCPVPHRRGQDAGGVLTRVEEPSCSSAPARLARAPRGLGPDRPHPWTTPICLTSWRQRTPGRLRYVPEHRQENTGTGEILLTGQGCGSSAPTPRLTAGLSVPGRTVMVFRRRSSRSERGSRGRSGGRGPRSCLWRLGLGAPSLECDAPTE